MMKLLSLKEIKIDYISCQFGVLHTYTMDIYFDILNITGVSY